MLLAGLTGAGVAAGGYRLLVRRPPGRAERWVRRNFRDHEVTLLAGPALAAGVLVGSAAGGGRPGAAAALATGGAAAFGLLDDLHGGSHARGFRGHLRALAGGEVTSGLVKLAGIGASGLLAGALLERRPRDVAVCGALIAGTANLANLLDLRPGRALKAVLAAAVPTMLGTGGAPVGAALAGAALAVLPEDLGERAMLGDTGANAAGAALGVALAAAVPPRARLVLLSGVVALTAASERVSFSAVINRTPALRAIDRLGRREGGQP